MNTTTTIELDDKIYRHDLIMLTDERPAEDAKRVAHESDDLVYTCEKTGESATHWDELVLAQYPRSRVCVDHGDVMLLRLEGGDHLIVREGALGGVYAWRF